MKILIIRFSSIGDIVLTTPVVRCLRKKYPEAQIHYATKRAFLPIVQHNPYINKVHLLGASLSDLVTELKQEKFDYVIDLHHNQRTLWIKAMLRVKSAAFNKLNFEKWLMVNFKIDRLPNGHIVDRYIATAAALGVDNDGEGLDYFIGEEDKVDVGQLGGGLKMGYLAWAIGAKQETKKFPVEKIKGVLNNRAFSKMPVVLLGGKEDADAGEQILKEVSGNEVINACGKFSLNQSASLVGQAKLVVANDTGLMHIAAAFKRPLIVTWGNTIPKFGMYPYYGHNKAPHFNMQVDGLKCRPCSKLGYSHCPKGHFNCMMLQDDNLLIKKIADMWR